MAGKEIGNSSSGYRQAQTRVKESRLVFTTCVGSTLGLLSQESFDVVIIDEASQQTEPASLIPLTKGCSRAVLVGDHVQLRATIRKHAAIVDYHISLFERHYNLPGIRGAAKVMLDTQYRMHSTICQFSSSEFYEGRLKTAQIDGRVPLPRSKFPWPEKSRMTFVQCSTPEDLGGRSKSNQGQVDVCGQICKLLSSTVEDNTPNPSEVVAELAILTPYTKQRELLAAALSSHQVSSVDGFQGREADIIVYVTVKCNVHCDIGFLKDMRRLNVAMTRAKAGVIILGDRHTLTETAGDDDDGADIESKRVWKRLIERCSEVVVPE